MQFTSYGASSRSTSAAAETQSEADVRSRVLRWGPRELALAILWLGFAAWLLVDGAYRVIAEIRCEREGQVVDAIVLTKYRKTIYRTVKSLLIGSIIEPRVSYSFPLPDGRPMRGDSPVTTERWRGLHERGPVRVRFVPAHPSFNRIEGEEELLAPAITAGLGIGLFVLWIVLFGFSSLVSLARWVGSRATSQRRPLLSIK